MIILFSARESLVSDIPAGEGKIAKLFFTVYHDWKLWELFGVTIPCLLDLGDCTKQTLCTGLLRRGPLSLEQLTVGSGMTGTIWASLIQILIDLYGTGTGSDLFDRKTVHFSP
jgi:hypothetical protein